MKIVLIYLIMFIMLLFGTAYGDVIIIANKDVQDSSLSIKDIKEIFLGKKVKWSDNQKVHFILSDDASLHEAFLDKYVKRSGKQFKMYWKKMVFSGKGKKPKTKSQVEIIEYVKSTKGAIGYINTSTSEAGLTTISVQ